MFVILEGYPPIVEIASTTFGELRFCSPADDLAQMSEADQQYAEIGRRLLSIRTAFSNLSQKAWAEKHGFNHTQYNNWERGTRRIPLDAAERLCKLYGLTLDFIYLGRRDGLAESASRSL